MNCKFDVITLCELVENRPCIWDKSNVNYKNKIVRDNNWEDIYRFLDDEYDAKTSAEKKISGDTILKTWNNMRDAFIRSLRYKSGQAAKKKYKYYNHLEFLLAIQEPSETQSSQLLDSQSGLDCSLADGTLPVEEDDTVDCLTSTPACRKRTACKISRSGKELNFLEKEIIDELKKPKLCEVVKPTFFGSFEHYTTDMSYTEQLELHAFVVQKIMEIRSRREQGEVVYVEQTEF